MSGSIATDDNNVLVVVDVQNDFCPGGRLAVPHGDEVVPVVNHLAGRERVYRVTGKPDAGAEASTSAQPRAALTMLQRFVDAAAVEAEIACVRSLSGGALRRRWQAVFGRSPPEHLTADLLRRMIAARVQEEAFGTLDRATLKLLDGLARRGSSRQPSATSRSAPCWSATIRAGATPSRSSPTAMSFYRIE